MWCPCTYINIKKKKNKKNLDVSTYIIHNNNKNMKHQEVAILYFYIM